MFICGESGVGKEVVARMIHMRSTRRSQPFVKVNCAALPGELLESELFGYEQGAFTGAVRSKPGKFELANKGTIFLDEIAEMSPHLQAKLLHVLRTTSTRASARAALVDVDVRVLAATNVEVQEAMKSGRFGRPLLPAERAFDQRAAAARTHHRNSAALPALPDEIQREISEGAPAPSEHLMEAAHALSVAGQPAGAGKLREALRDSGRRRRQFPRTGGDGRGRQRTSPARRSPRRAEEQGLKALVRGLKDEAEMEAIADALEKTHWCRKDAAKMLGISYKALLYKIRQFNLDSGRGARSAGTRGA